MDERIYWLGFSAFSGIGPAKFQLLLNHFGSAKSAWEASVDALEASGIGKVITAKFAAFRETFSLEKYLDSLQRQHIDFVILSDETYPKQLKELEKCPFLLYVRGDKNILSNQSLAVVGTRKITAYGRHVTELFTRALVSADFTIVSGLAMGVDAVAHQTTIDQGGKTIAVLGCGVDCCSPGENQSLYNSILEHGGVIVSEMSPGQPPTVGSFPARNRIVAALSAGIVVTEGTEDSGALITAEFGLQLGRKVFAVPGPITSILSKGPYKLIQQGAKLVTSGEEIVKELGITSTTGSTSKKRREVKGDTAEEEEILQLLRNETLSFDELIRKTKIDSSALGSLLSLMEIKGLIKTSSSGYYSLNE